MKLWPRLVSLFCQCHTPCPWCNVRLEFTGEPARNPLEALVLKIAEGHKYASFHRLEDQLAKALYDEELRRGAWVTDVGVWGPDAFRKEAFRLLKNIRPEFVLLSVEGGIGDGLHPPGPNESSLTVDT